MITDAELLHEQLSKMKQCGKILGNETLPQLISLMFTPQGTEFCMQYGFPKLEDVRKFDKEFLKEYHFFVDDYCEVENCEHIVLFGNTHAVLRYNDVQKLYKVLCFGNVNVRIIADNYTVVMVESNGANVLVEKKGNAKVFVKECGG